VNTTLICQQFYLRDRSNISQERVTIIEIDEVDNKILSILIRDARARLKDIAKDCGMSSVSVLKRIKRLKTLGVITGATLFPRLELLGFEIVATIGIEADANENQIIKFIGEHTDLIEPSASIGEYDLTALVYVENIYYLEKVVSEVRKIFGVRKVTVNVWSGKPHMVFENIDLQPKVCDKNRKA
jgi:Lrp/AsnC family transcriptional regulator for asnA, asnC and gidA